MFKKILVANRGEIALRIIRACQEMGIKTVTIYPSLIDVDQFLEAKLSDESYCLREEGILGYLDQKRIIQIAKKSGADAIHPGYGFLAENGDFADLCRKNKIKFIGPNGDTLRKLGNKIEAKKIARKIGLPLLFGSDFAVRDEKELLRFAKEIKPPFLLKAANGGGGVGIKMIEKEDKKQLLEVFRKLKRETKSAFDSEEIFIEKFLKNPHHIEFQILGDGKGKIIHFGERECSIQRRHQKLIEEAPSPFLDRKMRKKIGKLVKKFGEFLKYESLGTIEFLINEEKKFFFLEVNPRLQVEHPVTELITGIDLVEQQIRVAAGEKLILRQKDIRLSGWAMEFRIYAEDALNNFQPQEGIISNYLAPTGKGIEIHSFCQPNQKIFPFFDSLISKLVVFNKNRLGCVQRAKRAFDEYIIDGLPNLIPFYKALLNNQKFLSGNLSTSFIENENIVEEIKKSKSFPRVKINGRKENNEELARSIAYLYLAKRKEEPRGPETNKWKMAERLKIFEER
jgi:acetyl-CoA carboxylase biotin carboxylase subunit